MICKKTPYGVFSCIQVCFDFGYNKKFLCYMPKNKVFFQHFYNGASVDKCIQVE